MQLLTPRIALGNGVLTRQINRICGYTTLHVGPKAFPTRNLISPRLQAGRWPESRELFSSGSKYLTQASTEAVAPYQERTIQVRSMTQDNVYKASNLRAITLVDPKGRKHKCDAFDGETILDIANAYKLDLEGACQGDCACSTCHVIATSDYAYKTMGLPSEREEDMLDLAFGLTSRSRLGCQVRVSEALDNIELKLPGMAQV